MMVEFNPLGFDPAYRVEVNPEFPSNGRWDSPVYSFSTRGDPSDEWASRWGPPLVVRITTDFGDQWVGGFEAGGIGGISGVFAGPGMNQLLAVSDGAGYLVDVQRPYPAVQVQLPVTQVVSVEGMDLAVVARFIDLVGVSPAGIAWRSSRLCVDDLKIVRADPEGIHCEGYIPGGSPSFVVDPRTGQWASGAKLNWTESAR